MQTRRSIIAIAGGLAATVAVIQAKPAHAALGVVPDAPKASPALTAAVRALGDARDALEAGRAIHDGDEAKVARWIADNPEPASKRGKKRWNRKLRGYRDEVSEESWSALVDLARAYRTAQFAVAKIEPRDVDELMLMAAVAAIYDAVKMLDGDGPAIISYRVALSYLRLYNPAIGGAA